MHTCTHTHTHTHTLLRLTLPDGDLALTKEAHYTQLSAFTAEHLWVSFGSVGINVSLIFGS